LKYKLKKNILYFIKKSGWAQLPNKLGQDTWNIQKWPSVGAYFFLKKKTKAMEWRIDPSFFEK
jgi:hypothetical protein